MYYTITIFLYNVITLVYYSYCIGEEKGGRVQSLLFSFCRLFREYASFLLRFSVFFYILNIG
jgi:hypothetical protein